MRVSSTSIALFATTGLLFGCAHTMNPEVTEAEVAYQSAMSDPSVASKGQVQLYEANKELDRAKKAFKDGEDEEGRRPLRISREAPGRDRPGDGRALDRSTAGRGAGRAP